MTLPSLGQGSDLCDSFVIKSARGDHAINIIMQINGRLLFYMLYVLFETLTKEK